MNWMSIQFLFIVAQMFYLDTQAIDFVPAFLQADLDIPVYMELLTGMDLEGRGKNSSHYICVCLNPYMV